MRRARLPAAALGHCRVVTTEWLAGRLKAPGFRHRPLMGVDMGRKNVGVALSDGDHLQAQPARLITIGRGYDGFAAFAAELAGFARDQGACALVVGYPMVEGRETSACAMVRQMVSEFSSLSGCALPVLLWDEEFTTDDAKLFRELLVFPYQDDRAPVDQVAAALILQGALAQLHRIRGAAPPPQEEQEHGQRQQGQRRRLRRRVLQLDRAFVEDDLSVV